MSDYGFYDELDLLEKKREQNYLDRLSDTIKELSKLKTLYYTKQINIEEYNIIANSYSDGLAVQWDKISSYAKSQTQEYLKKEAKFIDMEIEKNKEIEKTENKKEGR